MRQRIKILLWTFWTISSLLLIVSLVTKIEITDAIIKRVLVFIFIIGQIRIFTVKHSWTWTKNLVVSSVAFGLFMTLNIYSDWRYDWETKTILFKNNHLVNRTIEYQTQKKGLQSYNSRIVDRLRLAYFVSWTRKINDDTLKQMDMLTWDKVDIQVRE